MRVTHIAIPSPKYFAPFSPIILQLRTRFKKVRVTHFAIPSAKYFAPFSQMLFFQRIRFKEERVTHFAILSPNYFTLLSSKKSHRIFKWIESIKLLGVYCSYSISSCRFYVVIEILSIKSSCFWVSICILWNIWSQMVFFLDINSFLFLWFFFQFLILYLERKSFTLFLLKIPAICEI